MSFKHSAKLVKHGTKMLGGHSVSQNVNFFLALHRNLTVFGHTVFFLCGRLMMSKDAKNVIAAH
jgi:hypothetical protein